MKITTETTKVPAAGKDETEVISQTHVKEKLV